MSQANNWSREVFAIALANQNLLWGAGIHVCPGAPLAQMELRVRREEVLASGASMEAVPGQSPEPALYPASGWARVPLRLLALQAG